GQCSVGACPEPVEGHREDWGGARNAVEGLLKHSSSTLRPESMRKTNRAFNAPVNVQSEPALSLSKGTARIGAERGTRWKGCSNTAPPRSGLNPCGKQTELLMRRSMFSRSLP